MQTAELQSVTPIRLSSSRLPRNESEKRMGTPRTSSGLRSVLLTVLPLIVADLIAALISFGVATSLSIAMWPTSVLFSVALASGFMIAVVVANLAVGLYPGIGISHIAEMRLASVAIAILCPVFLVASFLQHQTAVSTQFVIVATSCALALLLPASRSAARALCSRFAWWGQPALVVGRGHVAASVFRHLNRNLRLGLRPLGIVCDSPEDEQPMTVPHYLGPLSRGGALVRELGNPWLVVAAPEGTSGRVSPKFADLNLSQPYPTLISYLDGSPSLCAVLAVAWTGRAAMNRPLILRCKGP